jgi:hypothetical protein
MFLFLLDQFYQKNDFTCQIESLRVGTQWILPLSEEKTQSRLTNEKAANTGTTNQNSLRVRVALTVCDGPVPVQSDHLVLLGHIVEKTEQILV